MFERYYEKSIIEQEISESRSRRQTTWDETKRSLRDARYRLSLRAGSLDTNMDPANQPGIFAFHRGIPRTQTVTTNMSLPTEDLLMHPMSP